ncbi:MAG: hypothetical protein ACI8W8_001337 [Rhodothermales bacterium]|jgi:hypothetical protein
MPRCSQISPILLLLLVASCGKPPPPDYERMVNHMVIDTFAAVESANHDLAINKLERLRELRPDRPLVYHLLNLQNESIAIGQARDYVMAGEYAAARAKIEAMLAEEGASRRLDGELRNIIALQQVAAYFEAQPFASVTDALRAIAQLPPAAAFASENYEEWLRIQHDFRDRAIRDTHHEAVNSTLKEIDLIMLGGDGQLELVCKRLRKLEPQHPFLKIHDALKDGSYDGRVKPYLHPSRVNDLALFAIYQAAGSTARPALAKQVLSRPHSSRTGFKLRVIAAIQERRFGSALLGLHALLAQAEDADLSDLGGELAGYFEQDDVKVRPTIDNVLNNLYRIQDQP